MNYLKVVGGVLCFLILASNVWSMSRWNEARGVYDDICYLRQAHLFQKFGVRGLDTDIAHDDDGYLADKIEGDRVSRPGKSGAPCHTAMPAAKKSVIQYPPGTGFVLALFPEGFQVIPLYVSASVIVFGFALLAIFLGRSTSSILLTTGFGCLAVYLMINPSKASYSVAPTMVVCALVGWSDGPSVRENAAAPFDASDDADRLFDRPRRQFQAAESVSLRWIFPVFWFRLFEIAETGNVSAGRIVRSGILGRELRRP